MRARVRRISIAFAATLLAYGVYALCAVPLIVPSVKRAGGGSVVNWDEARASPTKSYERLLRHYFPADSWVLGDPKILESDQGVLLIKDYQHVDTKSISLAPFAMVLFPSAAAREDPSRASEALVIEAPEAVLDFDREIEFARAKLGNLKGGRLTGDVTIRSDQKLPGPADDLLVATRNIVLSETKMETQEAVQFRMGANVGSGRLLRIHLAPKGDARGKRLAFGGVQSLELVYDVKMHFQMGGRGLLPADSGVQGVVAARPAFGGIGKPASSQPPIEISSQGPFRFDFAKQEASFERNVDVLRLNPVGESDQLSCERLSVDFAPREASTGGTPVAHEKVEPGMNLFGESAKPQASDPEKERAAKKGVPVLEVRRLRAVGRPVVIRSPSTGAAARCERIEYDVKTGRITLEDPARVMLRNPRHEISAPKVSYTPGAPGSLPAFEAVGSGWLEGMTEGGATEGAPPARFRAAWQREIRLRPHEGRHLLSVLGKAELAHEGAGSLAAEEIWLWIREQADAKSTTKARQGDGQFDKIAAQLAPDRMLANGAVAIRSTALKGDAGRFEVWFANESESAHAATAAGNGGDAALTQGTPRRPLIAAAKKPPTTFEVAGEVLRLNVRWGERPLVDDVEIVGSAHFGETVGTASAGEPPLSVRGHEVRVSNASETNAVAKIKGQPAIVSARGLSMSAAEINVDRGANRVYIDGPGQMVLPLSRDFSGQPIENAQGVTIAWQASMNFDGQTVRYDQQVEASGASQRLTTQSLQARLAERIDFAAPPKAGTAPKLAAITCQGRTTIENRTVAGGEQTAFDVFVAQDLAIDQISGAMLAHGPGSIRSHRMGAGQMISGRGQVGTTNPADRPAATSDRRITFLESHFAKEARGNLHDRQITFSDQVRCVYGPVADWNQSITVDVARALPEGVITLASDRLTVSQPAVDRSLTAAQPIELAAEGNTFIEGTTFTARAERMTYAQGKDLLVLEGSGRADALLTRQTKAGGPTSKAAAKKIMFWRSTNTVEVDDAKSLNLSDLAPRSRGPRY